MQLERFKSNFNIKLISMLLNVHVIFFGIVFCLSDHISSEGYSPTCQFTLQHRCQNLTLSTSVSAGTIINVFELVQDNKRKKRSYRHSDVFMSNSAYFKLHFVYIGDEPQWRLTVSSCLAADHEERLEISISNDRDINNVCSSTIIQITTKPTVPDFFGLEEASVICRDYGRQRTLNIDGQENMNDGDKRKRRAPIWTSSFTGIVENSESCKPEFMSVLSTENLNTCAAFHCSVNCTNSEKIFWVINGTDIVTSFTDVDFNITYQLQVTCTDSRLTESTHKNVSVQTFNVSFRSESVCNYLVNNTYISANSSITSFFMTNSTVIRKHVTKTGLHYVSLSKSVTLAGSPAAQAAKDKNTFERTTNGDWTAGKGIDTTKLHAHDQATSIKYATIHSNSHRHQSSQQLFQIETIATVISQTSSKSPEVATATPNNRTARNATDVSIMTGKLFTISEVTRKETLPASTSTVSLFTYPANDRMHNMNTTPASNVKLTLINDSILTSERNTIQSCLSSLNAKVSAAKEPVPSTTPLMQSELSKNTKTENDITSPILLSRRTVTDKNRNNLTTKRPVLAAASTYLSFTVPTDESQGSTENIKPWTEVNGNDRNFLSAIKDRDNIIKIAATATVISFIIGIMVSAGVCCVMRKLCSTPEVPRAVVVVPNDENGEEDRIR